MVLVGRRKDPTERGEVGPIVLMVTRENSRQSYHVMG